MAWRKSVVLVFLALIGCRAAAGTPATAPFWGTPAVYATVTPAAWGTPEVLFPAATPTPQVYVVRENDTLIGIATRFGVSLEALKAANPEVTAAFLMPGQNLVIPTGEESVASLDVPENVRLAQWQCYPAEPGRQLCLGLLVNEDEVPWQDVSLNVLLDDQSQPVFPLLDVLYPQAAVPLTAWLPEGETQVALRSGLALTAEDARFSRGRVQAVQAIGDGRVMQVHGEVLPLAEGEWQTLWVAVSGLDARGRLVAARRGAYAVRGAAAQPFSLWLTSAAAPIVRVEVEAQWSTATCEIC